MFTQASRFCPYCFSALIGFVILAALPDGTTLVTPAGPLWLWLLAIPAASAVVSGTMRRMLRSRVS